MEPNKLCTEFSEAKQNEYEKEIRERFGYRGYEGVIDWNSYAPAEKEKIKNESEEIYRDLIAKMALGPQSRKCKARSPAGTSICAISTSHRTSG